MARQIAELKITGTIDGICFYKMHNQYYVRMKSSLTGKRFQKDKAFEGSRRSAERFAMGNRIASQVYRMVEKEKRAYRLFCFLKRSAIALGKERKNEKEIKKILIELLHGLGLSEPGFGRIWRLGCKESSHSRKSINPPKSWFRQIERECSHLTTSNQQQAISNQKISGQSTNRSTRPLSHYG